MNCPHGFQECIKTCNTPTCHLTCSYAPTCCKEHCFFYPGSVLSDIQQGNFGNHPYLERLLKSKGNEVLNILTSLGQVR